MDEKEKLRIEFDQENNQSLAFVDGEQAGKCQFEAKDGKWHITHTLVRPEYGGRGIARKLVEKLVEEARRKGVHIVPICSYAKKMLQSEEYADIL